MPPSDPPPAPAAPARYRRLPGQMATFRLASKAASVLWLGEDHVLQVETIYYTESYKRFAYGDIQALLLRETSRGLIYTSILGTLTAGLFLLAWSMEDQGARAVFACMGGFCLLPLIVNLIYGKTCRCQLQTAAGPHPLLSLNRVRPARKTLRLITEKVEAVQGPLVAESTLRQPDNGTQ